MSRRKLIAGNWKMNGLASALVEIDAIDAGVSEAVDVAICPPFTLIAQAAARVRRVAIGGQDCHPRSSGAHTGSISAAMLADAGATMCIVGHSERRCDHGESDAEVRAKAEAAVATGMTAILCVGETLAEREAGRARAVVERQLAASLPASLDGVVLAYEPVWAIGTGLVPSCDDVAEMHAAIRTQVGPGVRILYGGSVKESNARDLIAVADVDGALVGGASMTAADFLPIVAAAG